MRKLTAGLVAAGIGTAVLVGAPAAYAGGNTGILNEISVPICAPNWAIVGLVIPVGNTTVACPKG